MADMVSSRYDHSAGRVLPGVCTLYAGLYGVTCRIVHHTAPVLRTVSSTQRTQRAVGRHRTGRRCKRVPRRHHAERHQTGQRHDFHRTARQARRPLRPPCRHTHAHGAGTRPAPNLRRGVPRASGRRARRDDGRPGPAAAAHPPRIRPHPGTGNQRKTQ